MKEYTLRAEKIQQRIDALAAVSEDGQGITRTFGTKAFLQGSALVRGWMEQAGLDVRVDSIGNVRGKLRGRNAAAKTFVIGSHIDTVVNAGRFDGPLGVLMGLDLLESLIERRAALPFHIELMGFSDEEGVRFHTTYLGSKVAAGLFEEALLQKQDAAGTTLEQAIRALGADPARLTRDALPKEDWLGYFEMHIEQGPVLWERGVPVAPVTAIAGQCRVEVVFTGMAGHAGTVPMGMRQDALATAADFILACEDFARNHGNGLVATVGKLEIPGSASNVIPGEVRCSLDLRSPDALQLSAAAYALEAKAKLLVRPRGCSVTWNLIQQSRPVACDTGLTRLLGQAVEDSGYELIPLVSGAGHDAVPISQVAPVTMLFLRCYKGISHNPLEDAETQDIASGIRVADRFLALLITHYQKKQNL